MKILLTCGFFFCYFACLADPIISGNATVQPGSTETYTANWESWGGIYENYANVTWTVTGGTLLYSDKHTATIQWDVPPPWENGVGGIEVYEDLGSQSGSMSIDIVNFIEGVLETCNGVLGAPAIAIDFGSGNNPGPPLPAGTTTYNYNSSCAIFSGEYTRTNSTVSCRNDWIGLTEDHTPGDINGYMLMIDADNNRGEVYRTTVNGLTNTFQYEFSVWVANIAPGYPNPRIHFELWSTSNQFIDKSGSYSITFDSQNPWQRISFMFPLPAGATSLQVVLVDENGNPDGNDFVVDDISFAPCYPPIVASFTANPTVTAKSYTCDNGTVNLYSWWPTPSSPYNNPGFQWQKSTDNSTWVNISGATTMNYTQTENTANIYYYRMKAYETSNPSQFVYSNTIIYYVQKMVVNPNTFYVSGCVSSPVELNPSVNLQYSDPSGPPLSYTYSWSPGTYLSNTQIANPTITLPALPPLNPPNPPNPPPPVNYFYTLNVQNTNYGCTGSNTQTVAHINPRTVYLFNAFTPNGDGLNDYFYPVNIWDYTQFGAEFSIYNRWGQVIFYRNWGLTKLDWSWDGKVNGVPQDPAVFVYTLRIPGCPTHYVACPSCFVNPPTPANNYTISGTFTLIR